MAENSWATSIEWGVSVTSGQYALCMLNLFFIIGLFRKPFDSKWQAYPSEPGIDDSLDDLATRRRHTGRNRADAIEKDGFPVIHR